MLENASSRDPDPHADTALHLRRIGLAAFLAAIALTGLYTLCYWGIWHNWFWKDPTTLSICGRDYAQPTVQNAQMIRSELYPVFRAPPVIGRQVYATTPPARRKLDRQPGTPCTGVLVIKDSSTRYRVFTLEGGP